MVGKIFFQIFDGVGADDRVFVEVVVVDYF